jgi:hypothetical protein
MLPLVPQLRRKVQQWWDSGYVGALAVCCGKNQPDGRYTETI